MSGTTFDTVIVGGGIVGLATAFSLARKRPGMRLLLLEKETELAFHQTGHNSGVIHSGIYYRPRTLKADLCVRGGRALIALCREQGIPFELCGKVVVALSEEELPRLAELHRRGTANGVPGLRLVGAEELKEIEPEASGLRGLHVPGAGIVDFRKVAALFAQEIRERGAQISTGTRLLGIRAPGSGGTLLLQTSRGEIAARFLINCGGLFSDRIARTGGEPMAAQIIPFRGEYYELVPSRRHLVRGLIYPVPDPALPFLGVHLSRTMHGAVEVGPNAVLAFKREGYRRWDLSVPDLLEMARFPGFWKMTARFWKSGWQEWIRSLNKKRFARSVQRLVPAVREEDLVPSKSGVRAQAVDRAGTLLDDFHLVRGAQSLHVVNAPSPAATASIAIGEFITRQLPD